MKKLGFISLILFLFILDGCKTSNDADFEVLEGEIISISCPDKVISGDKVKINVQFRGLNGCSEGFNITSQTIGQTVTLKAFFKQPSDGRICTEILPVHNLTYTFFADFAGVYFFQSAQDVNIADTLSYY